MGIQIPRQYGKQDSLYPRKYYWEIKIIEVSFVVNIRVEFFIWGGYILISSSLEYIRGSCGCKWQSIMYLLKELNVLYIWDAPG